MPFKILIGWFSVGRYQTQRNFFQHNPVFFSVVWIWLMPYPHSYICCHFSYISMSCSELTKVWAKVFGLFCPLGIFCICTKPVFLYWISAEQSVKCERIGAKYFNFYLFCILKWVMHRVKNSETVFPGKILILIVSSSLNVSVTPPNVLNLSVHLYFPSPWSLRTGSCV